MIKTSHNKVVALNIENYTLFQCDIDSQNEVLIYKLLDLNGDEKLVFKIDDYQFFIKDIDLNGKINFTYLSTDSNISFIEEATLFSIKKNEMYLSAKKNDLFGWVPHIKAWELFVDLND